MRAICGALAVVTLLNLIDQMNIPIPANTTKGSVNISCSFGFLSSAGSVSSSYTHGNSNTVTIVVQ